MTKRKIKRKHPKRNADAMERRAEAAFKYGVDLMNTVLKNTGAPLHPALETLVLCMLVAAYMEGGAHED